MPPPAASHLYLVSMTPEPHKHLSAVHRTSERHEGRAGLICLDRNERVSPIPEAVFRRMLASLTVQDVMSYPDAGGFVSRLSKHLGFPEDYIAETAGSDAAFRRLFMAYLGPGAGVVSLNPSYAMYHVYTRIFRGTSRQIDYREDRTFDLDAFLAAVTPGVGIVILANPDQPIGTAIPIEHLRRIVARAAEVGAVCTIDEAYHPFFPVTAVPLVREFDNLLVTRSFSKYPGCAGLRLGYAIGHPALIKGLMAVRGGNEVSGVTLALGCYLLDHTEIAEDFRLAAEQGRQLLNAYAERLGLDVLPCVTNFQLLRCRQEIDQGMLAAALKRRGYLIKAGFTQAPLRNCIRISLNGPDIMQPFLAALADAIADLRPR